MTEIAKLNLSENLINKLKGKSINSVTEVEANVCQNILNGKSVAVEGKICVQSYIAPLVKKLEDIKKLKDSRKARLVVVVDSKESCESFVSEMKSLLTKELVIVPTHDDIKVKKTTKTMEGPVDVVVGTIGRISALMKSLAFNTKSLKHILINEFEKSYNDEVDVVVSTVVGEDKAIQIIAITNKLSQPALFFMDKSTSSYESIKNNTSEDSESEESESEDSKSEESKSEEIKNGNSKNEDSESESENSGDDESEEAMEADSEKEVVNSEKHDDNEKDSDKIDEHLLNKLRNIKNSDKFEKLAKKVIEEFSAVVAVSKLLTLTNDVQINESKNDSKKPKPQVHSGSGSKLSGRDGYTAYHFIADKEINSKGYLFKSLKRLIAEDTVEKIERVQHTKDLMGFVFDLPTEFDDDFQGSWRDGKYDTMSLLTEMPELSDESDRNGGQRGSFRGRGGDRGGSFRGRGGDRGGFRGRGGDRGRGNNRGGFKRPGASEGGNNSKLQKFD